MSDIKDRAMVLLKQAVETLEIVGDNYTNMAFNPEKGYCANHKCDNNCPFYCEVLAGCEWEHLAEAKKLIEDYEKGEEPTIIQNPKRVKVRKVYKV